MPTDLTGTPTSLGIGTYNTSVDAPSGLGFNAAMAQIDALLAARVTKPSGIASGEVPVWNGTTWVRSSTTNIGPASLGSGTPDATKFLRGDGSWQVPSGGAQVLLADSVLGAPQVNWLATTLLGGNIPGTYKHLRLYLNLRGTQAAASVETYLILNGDNTLNYGYAMRYNTDSGTSGVANNASFSVIPLTATTTPGATGPAAHWSAGLVIDILDYTNTTFSTTVTWKGWGYDNVRMYDLSGTGRWFSTAAVTNIQISMSAGNIAAGSRFSLYGIA